MKKALLAALPLSLALLSTAASPAAQAQQTGKLKACFIYVGPVGDIGWSYAHDEARKKTEKALPGWKRSTWRACPRARRRPSSTGWSRTTAR